MSHTEITPITMVVVFFSLIIETRGGSRISQCGQEWVLSMLDFFFVMKQKRI